MSQLATPLVDVDVSRLPRFVTSKHIRQAISSAYSTKLNPRNLETNYYPPYTHSFSRLTDFQVGENDTLIVCQEYNIDISKAHLNLYKLSARDYETFNDVPNATQADFDSEDSSEEEDRAEAAPNLLRADIANAVEDSDHLIPILLDVPGAEPTFTGQAPPTEGAGLAVEGLEGTARRRSQRTVKPPRRYAKDWIANDDVRAILYNPTTSLTAEERLQAIENLLRRSEIAEDPRDATLADTSSGSLATVPDDKGQDSFPDLVVRHTHAVESEKPFGDKQAYGWECRLGLKILHQCFPLIMEIKGCPSRKLRGEELRARLRKELRNAELELYEYIRTCFTRDLCAESAIAVSAAGPYWRWTTVKREDFELSILEWFSDYMKGLAFVEKIAKVTPFFLGTPESDAELTKLRDTALIPILTKHYNYPSTTVPNPQPVKPLRR